MAYDVDAFSIRYMAKRGPKKMPKRNWVKLTMLLTPDEMAQIDAKARRLTLEVVSDGRVRAWTRSDVVRRWITRGREKDE